MGVLKSFQFIQPLRFSVRRYPILWSRTNRSATLMYVYTITLAYLIFPKVLTLNNKWSLVLTSACVGKLCRNGSICVTALEYTMVYYRAILLP